MSSNNLMVYLKTTDTCQLNCSHCFTNGSNGKKGFFNVSATLKFFKNLYTYNPNYQHINISFHGGEPFLCPTEKMFEFYHGVNGLWPQMDWSIQTNLTYKVGEDKLRVFNEICKKYWGTSWDYKMRWKNPKQEQLWKDNLKNLTKEGHKVTVMVGLTKGVVENFEPIEIIDNMAALGAKYILFERITLGGNALSNAQSLVPENKKLDEWIMKMYEQCELHQTEKYINNMYLESIVSSVKTGLQGGNMCRNCEQKILTINADGTVGGCPNEAVQKPFGSIHQSIVSLMTSPGRICNIQHELLRNPLCYKCEVFDICNGDCHQLQWQGDVCASPKTLMTHLKKKSRTNLPEVNTAT